MERGDFFMTKVKKCLQVSLVGLFVFSFCVVTAVWANVVSFKNLKVPTAQGYQLLATGTTSKDTSWSAVNLSAMTPDAVTFSVSATKSNGSWKNYGTGTVYKNSYVGKTYVVEYYQGNIVAAGTDVQARFRNHNFSFSSNTITGEYDYSF